MENVEMNNPRIAVFCVGNRLHMDDGVGPAVFDAIKENYEVPDDVVLLDVGVMTMDLITYVDRCDVIIAVDAVEETGYPVGTIVRFKPEDMARRGVYAMSLHDMKLSDLFDAAMLVGYEAEGICLGMQVENTEPEFLTQEMTPAVQESLPHLIEALITELKAHGVVLQKKPQ